MAESRTVTVYSVAEKKSASYRFDAATLAQVLREEQKKQPAGSYTDADGKAVALDWTKWRLVKIA
jgi:hypothetical protein